MAFLGLTFGDRSSVESRGWGASQAASRSGPCRALHVDPIEGLEWLSGMGDQTVAAFRAALAGGGSRPGGGTRPVRRRKRPLD